MDFKSFKTKIELINNNHTSLYMAQYNDFWKWKIAVEKDGKSHILDSEHIAITSNKLISVLPIWQTYRGIKCDYKTELPISLSRISTAYGQIRHYSLLEFNQVPDELLVQIWHELGRVKERFGNRRADFDYYIIAVCKPLMFIWGQTLAFDSENRRNIKKDYSLRLITASSSLARWKFLQWKETMHSFRDELVNRPYIIDFCQREAYRTFGLKSIVPYGRFLDLYYYY